MTEQTRRPGTQFDSPQLEAVLRQIEQSFERSTQRIDGSLARITSKLETFLGRLETKLDILQESIRETGTKIGEVGNTLGRGLEGLGQLTGDRRIEGAGKVLSILPSESPEERKFFELFTKESSELLAKFRTTERRIASLETGSNKAENSELIADIRRGQQRLLSVLITQAEALRNMILRMGGFEADPNKTTPFQRQTEKDFKAVIEVLDEIKNITTDPSIRKDIERSPVLVPPIQKSGALTSPRRMQLASGGVSEAGGFGGAPLFADLGLDSGAESLAGFAERLAELPGAFVETREQAGSFGSEIDALVERLGRTNLLFGEQSGLLGQLTGQAPVLGGELAALFEEGAEAGRVFSEVTDAVGASLLDAFEGAIARGESLSDVLKGLAIDMAEILLKSAGNALLGSILGGLLGGLGGGIGGGRAATAGTSIPGGIGGFAKGGAFDGDSVMARNLKAFARGGIVDTPESFAFANGLGIMGEAGPEAILPLARARSGELGVRAMIGNRSAAGGSAPAAAGPTFIIDARGADREGMRELLRFIQFVDGKVNQVDRSIEPRALRAWANHRRRGGFR